jgi:hypothetical protein
MLFSEKENSNYTGGLVIAATTGSGGIRAGCGTGSLMPSGPHQPEWPRSHPAQQDPRRLLRQHQQQLHARPRHADEEFAHRLLVQRLEIDLAVDRMVTLNARPADPVVDRVVVGQAARQ